MIDDKTIEEATIQHRLGLRNSNNYGLGPYESFKCGASWAIKILKERSVQEFEEWWSNENALNKDLDGWACIDSESAQTVWQAATIAAEARHGEEMRAKDERIAEVITSYERCFDAFCKKDMRVKELESRLVAPSVVNHEALLAQLAEVEELIEFYATEKNWIYPGNDFHHFVIAMTDVERVQRSHKKDFVSCGGKRARAYLVKYSKEQKA